MAFSSGNLTLTGGSLPAAGSCTFGVTLLVPLTAAAGRFPNTTSAITADIDGTAVTGNTAMDNLIISTAPLLSKSFIDDPVGAGGTATLRFTLTNTSPTAVADAIAFTDNLTDMLPGLTALGLPVTEICGSGSFLTTTTIIEDTALSFSGGTLAAGEACTFDVSLQVPVGTPSGRYVNTTSDITALIGGEEPVTGKPTTDDLVVAAAPTLLKEFIDDPVSPGGTVSLGFTLTQETTALSDATGITFTDDLAAVLPGLTVVGLPMTGVCGSGSVIDGTSALTLSGGTLAPGASCTFSVILQVPATAPVGSHTNTTSSVVATALGLTVTGNAATDALEIAGLTLIKEFTDDPVVPGAPVNLRFTINNISPVSNATDIFFLDDLDNVLDNLTATGLPLADACGSGSQLAEVNPGVLTFSGGSLAPGASCTFDVSLQVPAAAASDNYINATSGFQATAEGSTVQFDNAFDQLIVSSDRLLLAKQFIDEPAAPGGSVTLEFTLTNQDASQPATDVAFTDDLDAVLPGLVATGLPASDVCGAGSQIVGTDLLSFTGGTLAAGASCSFGVTLSIPSDVVLGTTYTNISSQVTGSIGGLEVTGEPAIDNLQIDFLTFSKAFDGPTAAGGSSTLSFTITNLDANSGASFLSFSDDLDAVIPGLEATGLPANDICGSGSVLSGTSLLTLSGGSLPPGGSCTFDVTLQVPESASPGSFTNTTSGLFEAGLPASSPAAGDLEVISSDVGNAIPTLSLGAALLLAALLALVGFSVLHRRLT